MRKEIALKKSNHFYLGINKLRKEIKYDQVTTLQRALQDVA